MRGLYAFPLSLLLLAGTLRAQDDFDDYGPKPTGGPKARAQYEANLTRHTGKPDILVLPGLVADRKARTVEVLAESTGLAAGDVAEFLLVDQGSSHGYEAMLWSFAKPSDVHRALEFIGLKAGTPPNPAVPRLWSDGDRVSVVVRPEGGVEFPIEHLIVDNESGETLPAEGFVFAGSIRVPSRDGAGEPLYAADAFDPRSVASLYNEATAVLDVPRHANQGELYGSQVVNPECVSAGGELLTIVMTPLDPENAPRARNLTLRCGVAAPPATDAFRLIADDDKVVASGSTLKEILEHLVAMRQREGENVNIYISMLFDDALPLVDVSKSCLLLSMVEVMGVIRIKPPAPGQLYHRAFAPDKRWLEPAGRSVQPWELHLAKTEGALAVKMVLYEAVWAKGSTTPTFTRRECDVAAPEAVRATLDAEEKKRRESGARPVPPVLLVFSEPGLRYGQVMAFVRPALSTHDTIYVFIEEE